MPCDELMTLTGEQLDVQGVTKGAQHTLFLNMLKDRSNLLKLLEKDLSDAACLKITLNEQGRSVFLTDSSSDAEVYGIHPGVHRAISFRQQHPLPDLSNMNINGVHNNCQQNSNSSPIVVHQLTPPAHQNNNNHQYSIFAQQQPKSADLSSCTNRNGADQQTNFYSPAMLHQQNGWSQQDDSLSLSSSLFTNDVQNRFVRQQQCSPLQIRSALNTDCNLLDTGSAATWSRSKRSSSLTTPAYCSGIDQQSAADWSAGGSCSPPTCPQQQDDVFSNMKTFRCHGELSPQNSVSGGSGSTSSAENSEIMTTMPSMKKNSFLEPGSGMKDVPVWLKSLRLHKYSPLFALMSYDEMMNLTEEQLEIQGVTKGARHKIVLNIQKLKDRSNLLKQLEKDLADVACLKTTLNELKLMICTPIRAFLSENHQNKEDDVFSEQTNDANLPALFARVLLQACVQIINVKQIGSDEDCFALAANVLDRCLNHEAFASAHKKRFLTMKQQIRRIWSPSSMPRKLGPRSNSWNKDRRQQIGGAGSSSSTVCPSSLLGLQRQNGLSRHFAGRNSNGFAPNFASLSISKPTTHVDLNGSSCFVPTSTQAYQCSNVLFSAPANQQGRSVFLSDSTPEAYISEARGNHPAVQRTISAPAFRPLGTDQSNMNVNGVHNCQQNSNSSSVTRQITPPSHHHNNHYSFFAQQQQQQQQQQTKSVDSSPSATRNLYSALQQQNGWSRDDSLLSSSSSLFTAPTGAAVQNRFVRQQQCSPFQNRSGWSCGFEEQASVNMSNFAPSPFLGVGAIGPIGTPRASTAGAVGLVQFNRPCVVNGVNPSNGSLSSANVCQNLSSSSSNGLVLNDINCWNLDQLCRRVMEAAIDCDKPEINGF